MNGIISAGGKGTRLHPITLEIPKPLLTVGRRPIVQHLVDLFRTHGVKKIFVTIHHEDHSLFTRWVKEYNNDDVVLVLETERLGTWGGIRKYLRPHHTETFVVSNGDQLMDISITELLEAHRRTGALVTLGTVEVENPTDYGVLVSELGGKVIAFHYKPQNPPTNFVMAGIYIAEPEIFVLGPDKDYLSLEEDILPLIIKLERLYECRAKGRWHDCGTFERYEYAIKDWTGKTQVAS